MLIAGCLVADADKRSLRLLSEQWKAAVDSNVTRYGLPALCHPSPLLTVSPCYGFITPVSGKPSTSMPCRPVECSLIMPGSAVWEATAKAVFDDRMDHVPCRLSGNQYKTLDRDLERLVAFKQLQSLGLSQCRGIRSLKGLARLPGLRSLELNFCTGLKPGALRVLAQLPELRKLDLSGCMAVTDECMSDIAGSDLLLPTSGEAQSSAHLRASPLPSFTSYGVVGNIGCQCLASTRWLLLCGDDLGPPWGTHRAAQAGVAQPTGLHNTERCRAPPPAALQAAEALGPQRDECCELRLLGED